MNYHAINTAILKARDVPKYISRDKNFYDYLLDNSVAYYYCKFLSRKKNSMDRKIITAGEVLNNKFLKTLELINKVCKENRIKFLLFKTYKYIPEVVDNDIDLFIKKKDFYNFMNALQRMGFKCFENEPLEGICLKEDFCKIEPRVDSSSRGQVFLNEKKIWENVESVNVDGIKVFKTTKEIDLLHLSLSILYNPNYLKLYLYLLYKYSDVKKLFLLNSEKQFNQDLKFLLKNLMTENAEKKRFPRFLGDINFMVWWYKRILPMSDLNLLSKFRHIVSFFHSKYAYLFFNKLIFKHNWPL